MYLKKVILLLLTCQFSLGLYSQEILVTVDEVVEKVLQNNIELQIADQDFFIKESDFMQSRAMYFPSINLSYTGMSTNSPLMAFGTKLNQSIVQQNDFNPALLNNPDPAQNFSFQLEVQQPILNFDKTHERNAAKLSMEAVLFQKTRTQEYLGFQTRLLYMQLQLAYRAEEVLNQAIETALTNQQHARNSYDAGYLQEADLLEIEVRINELRNKLLSIQNQINTLSDQIHQLMQDRNYNLLKPSEKLEISSIEISESMSSERADFLAMDKANAAYTEILQSTKKSNLPRLNAFATFQTNDDDPISTSSANYMVGIQLSWNIFDGHQRSAKIQRSSAQLAKAKLEKKGYMDQNETEFQKARRDYMEANAKLKTIQVALKQAEESLRIRSNRLAQGLEKASDVLMAETKYAEQKLMESQTIFQINYAALYAQFLSQ